MKVSGRSMVLSALLGNYDRQTNQPIDHQTDIRGHVEVTVPI